MNKNIYIKKTQYSKNRKVSVEKFLKKVTQTAKYEKNEKKRVQNRRAQQTVISNNVSNGSVYIGRYSGSFQVL